MLNYSNDSNAENLLQYKSRSSFSVEQILDFDSSTNLDRQVNCITMFYIIEISVHLIVKL